jgi:uncharacterized membrane protein
MDRTPSAPLDVPQRTLLARSRDWLHWSRVYRTTSYVRSALWVVPLVAIVLVLLFAPMLRWFDGWLKLDATGLDSAGSQALYQTSITLTLSFLVFTFGSLLVAIQIAGGQLTPRIIATALLRDNVVRYSVGLFTFTLLLSVIALNRVHGEVHDVLNLTVGALAIACMTDFLFLIDYAARLLRPVSILSRIGNDGLRVVAAVYPEALGGRDDADDPREGLDAAPLVVLHEGASAVLLAIDVPTLVREARRAGGLIELVPQVGDFVAYGEPLFRLHAGAVRLSPRQLLPTVALGPERTIEQDPMFAFRIVTDIALKALSPAINDPTTAVLALDQLHRLLRDLGQRKLRGDAIRDAQGALRVLLRTPDWEDFVHVACVEIRACGASSVQVPRRMEAMLLDLLAFLPPSRHAPLGLQRELLARAVREHYAFPEDAALALVPDVQGLGGSPRARLSA